MFTFLGADNEFSLNGVKENCVRTTLEPLPLKQAADSFAAPNCFARKDQRAAPNWSEDDQMNDVTAGLIKRTQKRTKNN